MIYVLYIVCLLLCTCYHMVFILCIGCVHVIWGPRGLWCSAVDDDGNCTTGVLHEALFVTHAGVFSSWLCIAVCVVH